MLQQYEIMKQKEIDHMITIEDVERMAEWSEPKELQTKFGPKIMRKAAVTPAFSAAWKTHKDEIKALGAGFGKDLNGDWELSWWQDIPKEVKEKRAASIEMSRATNAEIEVPHPDGIDYYPFQKAGIRYALDHKNVLIGDEPGLGKTLEAIGIINVDPTIFTAIIVCPKSLKLNWYREISKWLMRSLTVAVINDRWVNADIVIINYESLGKWNTQIQERVWGAAVIDEAHWIKSKKAQRSQYVKAIKSVRKIRMTGTPICNRPSEVYNIIEDMTPVFGSFFSFAKRYCNGQNNGFGWDFTGASNLDELQKRLRETIMVRRLKSEVLTELPRKIRQIIEIEPETAEQQRAVRREGSYEADSESRLIHLRAAVEMSKAESEEAYKLAVEKLKDASQVDFQEMSKLRHETALSKVPAVINHIKLNLEDNDNKIFIAAHHHDVIAQLMEGLKEYNAVKLVGGDSEESRQAAVDRFQTDPTCRIFVGSIMAAGVGITLTASSHAVFAELDWTPGNVTQCEDRIHRIGQTQTVLVQHLVLSDSLDARMANILVSKQNVIDNALDVNHPERTQPAYEPKTKAASSTVSVTEIEKQAAELSEAQVEEIHAKLRILAGMDMDHATDMNEAGFNKLDSAIGHSLADQWMLTPKQAIIGMKLCIKYRRQIGALSWLS
jgi:SWI/SNF-related matrix-associated actin-dependent regulator 1 of chromatin subfamily A